MAKDPRKQTDGEAASKTPRKRTTRKKVPPDAMKRIGNRWEQLRKFLISKGLDPRDVAIDPSRGHIMIICNAKLGEKPEDRIGLTISISTCELTAGPNAQPFAPMGMPVTEPAVDRDLIQVQSR